MCLVCCVLYIVYIVHCVLCVLYHMFCVLRVVCCVFCAARYSGALLRWKTFCRQRFAEQFPTTLRRSCFSNVASEMFWGNVFGADLLEIL